MERAPAPYPVPILTMRLIEGNLLLLCSWSRRMITCWQNAVLSPPFMHSHWRRLKTVLWLVKTHDHVLTEGTPPPLCILVGGEDLRQCCGWSRCVITCLVKRRHDTCHFLIGEKITEYCDLIGHDALSPRTSTFIILFGGE